jgi:hypothetical protein
VGTDVTQDESPARERGIGRRTLIKRAAAAGAVAWSAPVILDSLSSPAAAFSCGTCFKVGFQAVDDNDSNPTGTGPNNPNGSNNSYPVSSFLGYPASPCTTPGDSACSNIIKQNVTLSSLGISISGGFHVDTTNSVTVNIAAAASAPGCTSKPTILGSSFVWRTSTGSFSECASPSSSAGTPPHLSAYQSTKVGATEAHVTWTMPLSDHPGHSGGFNFVVGCSC